MLLLKNQNSLDAPPRTVKFPWRYHKQLWTRSWIRRFVFRNSSRPSDCVWRHFDRNCYFTVTDMWCRLTSGPIVKCQSASEIRVPPPPPYHLFRFNFSGIMELLLNCERISLLDRFSLMAYVNTQCNLKSRRILEFRRFHALIFSSM